VYALSLLAVLQCLFRPLYSPRVKSAVETFQSSGQWKEKRPEALAHSRAERSGMALDWAQFPPLWFLGPCFATARTYHREFVSSWLVNTTDNEGVDRCCKLERRSVPCVCSRTRAFERSLRFAGFRVGNICTFLHGTCDFAAAVIFLWSAHSARRDKL
jgi:hypothetical protein